MPACRSLPALMLAAVLSAATGVTGAIGQTASETPPVLRGQQTADAPAAAPAPDPPVRSALMSPITPSAPRFAWDSAPRLRGFAQDDAPGQCRRACSSDYYRCGADDSGGGECPRVWIQCLAACPR